MLDPLLCPFRRSGHLVGAWFTGASNLLDQSGFSPTNTHDGYGVKGANLASADFTFITDRPPTKTNGFSLSLPGGDTAIAISNTAPPVMRLIPTRMMTP